MTLNKDDISPRTLLVLCLITLALGLLLGAYAGSRQSNDSLDAQNLSGEEILYKNIQPGRK